MLTVPVVALVIAPLNWRPLEWSPGATVMIPLLVSVLVAATASLVVSAHEQLLSDRVRVMVPLLVTFSVAVQMESTPPVMGPKAWRVRLRLAESVPVSDPPFPRAKIVPVPGPV